MADTPAQVHREQARSASKYCRDWAELALQERSGAGVVLHSLSPVSCRRSGRLQWRVEFSKRRLLVSKTFWLVKKEG